MSWERPTLKELVERSGEDLSVRLLDGAPLEPRSVLNTIATMRAGGEHLMYGFLEWAFKQIFVHSAESEYLLEWARVWGVSRKPAVSAQGLATVRGQIGAALMDDSLALGKNGQRYRLAGITLTAVTGQVEVEAVEPGAAGNLPMGSKISLISPQAGITSELTIAEGCLAGGVDIESDDSLRSRLLKTIQSPPHGGNKADYELWALAVPGVENSLCYPTYAGVGSVAVAVWGDMGGDPVLSEAIVESAYDYIKTQAPVTAGQGLHVFTPVTLPVNFTIKLTPDTPVNRENVVKELGDVFAAESKPGAMIPLTHLAEAISRSHGEWDHVLVSPTQNITPEIDALPIIGTVNWVS
jgi:uncharacterized phage protein gp47/JayE